MMDDGRAESIDVIESAIKRMDQRLERLSELKMTQEQIVRDFQDKMRDMLAEFEATTGYRAEQTAALPPALKAVIEAAGAPSEGWRIEVGWTFTPITRPENTASTE